MAWLTRVGIGCAITALLGTGVAPHGASALPNVATTSVSVTASSCRYVFLSPHQDDEVLSMGAAIRSHVERAGGNSVCVALFSTGESSAVRARFGGRGYVPAGRTAPYVNPAIAQSPKAFARARDREFAAALGRLGVPAKNVYLDDLPGWTRVPDRNAPDRMGEIRRDADEFVDATIAHFGSDASYATMSDVDPSADHRALGLALRARSGDVGAATFYYPQYQVSLKPGRVTLTAESAADPAAVKRAASEYGLFQPAAGRYGIGWLSATRAFGAGAFEVKVWALGRWCAPKPFGAGPDRSFLATLKSYRHS